jgi:CBS domain-containing protein
MQTVHDIMIDTVPTIESTATVREAAQLMARNGIDFLDVVHDGVSAGLVTDHDVVVHVVAGNADPDETPVSAIVAFRNQRGEEPLEVINAGIATLSEETPIDEALHYMDEKHVHRLIVHDHDYHTVGVVSRADLREAGADMTETAVLS